MGTEVSMEIPLEKRNLLPSWQSHFVSIFCQLEWVDTQVYVSFDAVVTEPAKVGFNLVGVNLIFFLNLFKI